MFLINISGLRHIPEHQGSLTYGTTNNMRNYHDKMNYERVNRIKITIQNNEILIELIDLFFQGFIQHSRSTSNQHINFHFMFGGFKEYVLNRYFTQIWYRRNIRNWWFPILLSYCCKFFYSLT